MIHECLSGHGCASSLLGASFTGVCRPDCGFRAACFLLLSLSSDVCASFLSPPTLPKSKAAPGVLGVFPEDPKDAKAPLPSPKAEEPLAAVGDETAELERLPMKLELLLLWPLELWPKRFEEEESGLSLLFELSPLFMERLSLLLL